MVKSLFWPVLNKNSWNLFSWANLKFRWPMVLKYPWFPRGKEAFLVAILPDDTKGDIFTRSRYFHKQIFSKVDIFTSGYFQKWIFWQTDIFTGSKYFHKRIFSQVFWKWIFSQEADIFRNGYFQKWILSQKAEVEKTALRPAVDKTQAWETWCKLYGTCAKSRQSYTANAITIDCIN